AGGISFSITYLGGTGGHDVVLTALATPTVTLNVAPVPCTYGQQITFTSTVSGSSRTPTGTVEFYDGDPAADGVLLGSGTLSGGTATYVTPVGSPLGAGAYQIYADYLGDLTYGTAVSPPQSYTVNSAPTITHVTA